MGINIKQPRTFQERVGVAEKCCSALEITMPMLVDTLDDRVGHAYSGMPDRLYVIDRDGRVAYKGGRGPFGFKSGEMEQALAMLLLDDATGKRGEVVPPRPAPSKPAPSNRATPYVPLLEDAETWKRLPPAEKGANQPLPAWARALVDALPRTTAALLELDYSHRVDSPLEPRLRGMIRWTAAKANRCAYGERQALADLERAAFDRQKILPELLHRSLLPRRDQLALEFADKLTTAAYSITDAEVAELIRLHGEKDVVAMVLLVAYANVQDRLILSLGLTPEFEEPRPPLVVQFRKSGEKGVEPAPRLAIGKEKRLDPRQKITDLEWLALDFDELQKRMESQRDRQPRIRVPDGPMRILWSRVCGGYQPKLAQAWGACMSTFRQESKQDRVFEELCFWVVTRSLHCPY